MRYCCLIFLALLTLPAMAQRPATGCFTKSSSPVECRAAETAYVVYTGEAPPNPKHVRERTIYTAPFTEYWEERPHPNGKHTMMCRVVEGGAPITVLEALKPRKLEATERRSYSEYRMEPTEPAEPVQIVCHQDRSRLLLMRVQQQLNERGHTAPLTGELDKATGVALRAFQTANGLKWGGLTVPTVRALGIDYAEVEVPENMARRSN